MARFSRLRGLSLIELLVAIAILATLYGAVVVAIGSASGPRVLEREGRRFAALVATACERAQISGRDYGVHVSRAGYAFSTALADGWRLETTGDLRPRELAKGLALELAREGTRAELLDEMPDAPQAACFASGELTPFVATVTAGELPPFEIDAALDGTIETRAREPDE